MAREYTLSHNLDRPEEVIDFEEGIPPDGSVLKIEDELIWRNPSGTYARGIYDTFRDRHFVGSKAVVVGVSLIEWEEKKGK